MDLIASHNAFALSMYNSFAMFNQGQNFLLSPISIFAALSMVLPGAKHNTLHQMLQAMKLNSSLPMEETEAELGKMLAAALGNGTDVSQLVSANRAYIDSALELKPEYKHALIKYMRAEPFKADFRSAADSERVRINNWVSDLTRSKIRDLLKPGTVNEYTRVILVNALYFKSTWSVSFDSEKTRERPFEVTAGSPVFVQMMERKGEWPVIRVPGVLTAVQFAFKEPSGLSMFGILPFERHQLDSMISSMRLEDWQRLLRSPVETELAIVRLPKVRLEGEAELEKPSFLPSVGVTDLFSEQFADLSRMSSDKLFVSSIVHKAVLEWDEVGAEGSAGTAAVVADGASWPEPTLAEIYFDQPFVVMVAKKVTTDSGQSHQVPILMGRVSRPIEK